MSGDRGLLGLRRWLPILTWLPAYDRAHLRRDVVAGAVVAALAVPQSLGYAAIAGVPVQVGLYAVPLALLAYAAVGTSPQLILGPVSTVSVLSASLVVGLHPRSAQEAVAYTSAVALAAGLVLATAGLLRVGWVAEFLSKPIITGFVLGLSILVIIGELPNLLGIPIRPGDVLDRISLLVRGVDDVKAMTAAVGVCALAVLFGGSRLAPRAPWSLIVLIGGLVASHALDLAARGVAVVGTVPSGLPSPSVPPVPAAKLTPLRSSSPREPATPPPACSAAWGWPEACPRPPPSTGRAGPPRSAVCRPRRWLSPSSPSSLRPCPRCRWRSSAPS